MDSISLFPTRSFVLLPTRLLAELTAPVMPTEGFAQVIAPALGADDALLQLGLRMATLLPMNW